MKSKGVKWNKKEKIYRNEDYQRRLELNDSVRLQMAG